MSDRIPEGYFEGVFQFNLSGDPEPMYTAMGFGIEDLDPDDTAEWCQHILTQFVDAFAPVVTNQYVLGPGFVNIGGDPLDGLYTGNHTAVGTLSGDASPQNGAVLVRKRGTSTARSANGRMFIPGLVEGAVDARGMLGGDEHTDWQEATNNWIEGTIDSPVGGAVHGFIFHATGSDEPAQVQSMLVERQIATQRRRMRR